jgi:hypothetical protein
MITEISPQKILQDIGMEGNQKGLEGNARKSPMTIYCANYINHLPKYKETYGRYTSYIKTWKR